MNVGLLFWSSFVIISSHLPTVESIACGSPTVLPRTSRVVNGHEARRGAWPWMVLLTELNMPMCGGAILNSYIVMTSAHCFDAYISKDLTRWKVIAGKHNTNRYDAGQSSYTIRRLMIHEKYNRVTIENDIALLLLSKPIRFTDFILPVCLPSSNEKLRVGQRCYLAGWGDTLGTSKETVLNQVMLPVVGDNTCSRPDWYGSEFIPGTMLCAGYASGKKDACTGDSGSPLVCKHGNRWYAQGIVSWGYGCAEPKWPNLYTEVLQYVSWVKRKAVSVSHPIKADQ